jgi:hypothetical protein
MRPLSPSYTMLTLPVARERLPPPGLPAVPATDDIPRMRARHQALRRGPGAQVRARERHAEEMPRVPRRGASRGGAQAPGEEEAGRGAKPAEPRCEDTPALGARGAEDRGAGRRGLECR